MENLSGVKNGCFNLIFLPLFNLTGLRKLFFTQKCTSIQLRSIYLVIIQPLHSCLRYPIYFGPSTSVHVHTTPRDVDEDVVFFFSLYFFKNISYFLLSLIIQSSSTSYFISFLADIKRFATWISFIAKYINNLSEGWTKEKKINRNKQPNKGKRKIGNNFINTKMSLEEK